MKKRALDALAAGIRKAKDKDFEKDYDQALFALTALRQAGYKIIRMSQRELYAERQKSRAESLRKAAR